MPNTNSSSFIVELDTPQALDSSIVGSKAASVADLIKQGATVPTGFVVPAALFTEFIAPVASDISKILETVDIEIVSSAFTAANAVTKLLNASTTPTGLTEAIDARVATTPTGLAVRSSATAEDLEGASFAGMYDTFLDSTDATSVLKRVRDVWGSYYTGRAISYRQRQGIPHESGSMAVLVMELVNAEAGGVFGPLWGGGITTWMSWEWAFWLNIPFTVIAAIWILRNPPGKRNAVKIDLPSATVFAALLSLLTIGLVRVGEPDALMAISLGASVVLFILLAVLTNRSQDPLFPKRLFQLPSFNYSNLTHFLVGAVLIIGMVTVPLMAASVFGKSPLEGGLQLLRMTIAIGIGAVAGGYVTQRYGARIPSIVGLLITTAGFLLLASWTIDIAEPALTIHLAITGLGLGLLVSPIAETALWGVQTDQRGAASSLLSVSRMVGMTAGLAVMTALGTVQFQDLVADVPAFSLDPDVQKQILDSATHAGGTVFTRFFLYGAIISAAALIPAWLMTRSRPTE